MDCLLCLESLLGVVDYVSIDHVEGHKLEAKNIVEKHFLWLKFDILPNEKRGICKECWHSLLTFHEFYKRVEEAHKSLERQDIKPLETYDFVEQTPAVAFAEVKLDELEGIFEVQKEIKEEPESTLIEAIVKPKRGRGRPRRQPLEETKTHVQSVRETRTSRKRTSNNDKKEEELDIEELQIPIIKTELVEVTEKSTAIDALGDVDAFDSVDAEDTLSECKSDSPISHSGDAAASRRRKSVKLPRAPSGKTLVSLQSDKYIAEHFHLSCCLCDISLENFTVLKTHFRSEHKVRGYVTCCGKKLLKRGVLVDHLRTHQDPTYFKCTLCAKVMSSRSSLEIHMKRHQQMTDYKYECEECGKKFRMRAGYTRHMLMHLPEEAKTIQCPQCDKTFAKSYVMNQHLKLVHLNTYGKMCEVCGKTLPSGVALRRHMEEHLGSSQPTIQCDICGLKLVSKYGLARHIKAIHTEESRRPQICPFCSKVSKGIKAHKYHIMYMHTMQPTHACRVCTKAFKRARELKEHMTTHTGEALYTCSYCPKTFKAHANMYSHCKKSHPKEWEERRLSRFNKLPLKSTDVGNDVGLPVNNAI